MSAHSDPIKRRYRMIRLSAGDYLLPGNDGETIFRLSKHDEDLWRVLKWPFPKARLNIDAEYGYDPLDDWEGWGVLSTHHATRQEAIDAALLWEWRRDNPVRGPQRKPVDVAAAIRAMATGGES